ncbi:helix-turn-helix transcriptional regulator [Ochrobactrum chromiisoli]|uniref:Helix-turn-helix transcriptional regulator n=1 Tax=Ochrobactrum chromiisoli TaxID=2993941 RepID=A0ABT3QSN8_9HYPH|nr:helix-turn-helix transcriptional regulator [Ochrobactrum chromiisoli]MCX2698540.1 helix-turn-helix transcriptional regulator [Ochrobactrum chromiisoli]
MPWSIQFEANDFSSDDCFVSHRHLSGQFSYSVNGVLELDVEGYTLLAPPQFGIWIPSERIHSSRSLAVGRCASIHVAAELCEGMPLEACTLRIPTIVKAISDDLIRRNISVPSNERDQRLMNVLIDQLQSEGALQSYLPTTSDPLLAPMIRRLQKDPGNCDTLAAWAERLNTVERVLAHRFRAIVGIGFNEWRQRLRFLNALMLLRKGFSIQEISSQLGYNTPSSFISMFRRHANMSPDQYRRNTQVNRL